jgi:hypothetical protein
MAGDHQRIPGSRAGERSEEEDRRQGEPGAAHSVENLRPRRVRVIHDRRWQAFGKCRDNDGGDDACRDNATQHRAPPLAKTVGDGSRTGGKQHATCQCGYVTCPGPRWSVRQRGVHSISRPIATKAAAGQSSARSPEASLKRSQRSPTTPAPYTTRPPPRRHGAAREGWCLSAPNRRGGQGRPERLRRGRPSERWNDWPAACATSAEERLGQGRRPEPSVADTLLASNGCRRFSVPRRSTVPRR